MRNQGKGWCCGLLVLAACTPHYQVTVESGQAEPPVPVQATDVAAPEAQPQGPSAPATPAYPWSERELPFEPSDDDRPFLGTGFTGYAAVPAETGYTQGVRVAGVQPSQSLGVAGLQDGDIIVAFGGQTLDGPQAELIQQLRAILQPLQPDTQTSLAYFRAGEGVKDVDFWLGRSTPPFARLETPEDWFEPVRDGKSMRDAEVDAWVANALALDAGEERTKDTLRRQQERFAKRDVFRLRPSVLAQLYPSAQETAANEILDCVARRGVMPAYVAGRWWVPGWPGLGPGTERMSTGYERHLNLLEELLVSRNEALAQALVAWNSDDRAWLAENVHALSERILVEGEYLYGDEDVARERANRRIVAMLANVEPFALATVADVTIQGIEGHLDDIARLAEADDRDGLLASRDTAAGRIEIWGRGSQTHKTRCLFRYDHGGNDRYLDTAGRADLTQPISISVDRSGDDVYGATAPFCQGGALGGIGVLIDMEGDDQYLAQQWSQGAAIAGVGILEDRRGNDTYRGREACQGVALVGGASLRDDAGDDTYSADRFSQGVGFAAGVGVIRDAAGNDRYSCTGKYPSEYGEDGLYSGWGQGVGFGFRHVASGGIGILHDIAGDDIYEAGNFSQGGAYFYAWGIFRDDAGNDRYIGSRYAQGYAAHQAAGTFIDGGGDDLYQSYSTVAQGLSWDETSVFFRDRGGNDRYESKGFSLASAAHNGMVIFVDDGGDDTYAELPAKASSNNYHGGWSFALFVDRAGSDHYAGKKDELWNGRAWWRHEGAYFLDLDGDRPIPDLVREPAKQDR